MDVIVYQNCKYVGKGEYDEDADVWRNANGEALARSLNYVCIDKRDIFCFPNSSKGMNVGIYSYEDDIQVSICTCSGFNYWRNGLAQMVGYAPKVHEKYEYLAGAIAATSGAFHEILNFSGSEGVIGTEACVKLVEDFQEYDEKARRLYNVMGKLEGDFWYGLYQKWHGMCEDASENGFLMVC